MGSHWNALMIFCKKGMTSDFNVSHGIMSDFFSFPLFKFTFIIKLKNFDLESQWNTQKIVKKMNSDWNMSCQRVSNLVLVSLFERKFENKLRITNFQVYWTSLLILNSVTCCQIKLCPGFFCLICISWH